MKTFFKSALVIVLICSLAISMAGCDDLDYRDAIDLYNAGNYDAAAEAFLALGDFEDSADLLTRSHYWAAIDLMEAGKYEEALPRFQKLGSFEDSAQRVTECIYQIAVAAFDAGNYADAQLHFENLADYRLSQEYLRRINWQKLYDEICQVDSPLQQELNGKSYCIYPVQDEQNPAKLVLSVELAENAGLRYADFLTVTLTRDSTVADFTCGSDFQMEYVDGPIGSSQTGFGTLNITTCTPDTALILDTFEKTVTDNLGNTITSQDPADSLMDDMMEENLYDLLTVIPAMLAENGITLTLHDIGFSAM